MYVLPHGQQGQVERHIADARITAENRVQGYQQRGHEQRLLPELQCQRHQVQDERVQLERVEEEDAEMIKHFRKEIPKQSNIRLQIAMTQSVKRPRDIFSTRTNR